MIEAKDCALQTGRYGFGLSDEATAAALRTLADDIERGLVLVAKVHTVGVAGAEEWSATRLVLTLYQRLDVDPASLPSAG